MTIGIGRRRRASRWPKHSLRGDACSDSRLADSSSGRPIRRLLIKVAEPGCCSGSDGVRIPQRSVAPVVDIVHHLRHTGGEIYLRLPAQFPRDPGYIRKSAIGFTRPLRDMNARASEQLDEVVNRLRASGANIPE